MSARAREAAARQPQLSCVVEEDVVEQLAAIPELRDGTTHINADSYIPPNVISWRSALALRQLHLPDPQSACSRKTTSLYVARPEDWASTRTSPRSTRLLICRVP